VEGDTCLALRVQGLGLGRTQHGGAVPDGAVGRKGMSVERTFTAISAWPDLEAKVCVWFQGLLRVCVCAQLSHQPPLCGAKACCMPAPCEPQTVPQRLARLCACTLSCMASRRRCHGTLAGGLESAPQWGTKGRRDTN
jgi:hypothetical protein